MAIPVRILIQVGDNEPNEVGTVQVASQETGTANVVAQALRELADIIELPEN